MFTNYYLCISLNDFIGGGGGVIVYTPLLISFYNLNKSNKHKEK